MMIELSTEAVNCLKFWEQHPAYQSDPSAVVLQLMEEWLMQDATDTTAAELEKLFADIKAGRLNT